MGNQKRDIPVKQGEELLETLKARFTANVTRHEDLVWDKVLNKLKARPNKLWSLNEMEATGGERRGSAVYCVFNALNGG